MDGLPLRTLEQTEMRVGELAAMEWRDVDVAGSRFRIRQGKTAAARRWATVPEWLMQEIAGSCPHLTTGPRSDGYFRASRPTSRRT
jgi:integrase